MLDDLLYEWEIHLCQMYEKHIDLTLFFLSTNMDY